MFCNENSAVSGKHVNDNEAVSVQDTARRSDISCTAKQMNLQPACAGRSKEDFQTGSYIHKQLKNGKWKELNILNQMANIGAEVGRAMKWKKNKKHSRLAFFRSLELLEFTIDDPKNRKRLKELTRLYEVLVDYFIGENLYGSSERLWDNYFYPFNYAARNIG